MNDYLLGKSNYSRIVIRKNELGDSEFTSTSNSFKIEIYYCREHQPERLVGGIFIEGTSDQVIELLNTLEVDRLESFGGPISVDGEQIIETVPFDVGQVTISLAANVGPITGFISDVTQSEVLDRLQQWRMHK